MTIKAIQRSSRLPLAPQAQSKAVSSLVSEGQPTFLFLFFCFCKGLKGLGPQPQALGSEATVPVGLRANY